MGVKYKLLKEYYGNPAGTIIDLDSFRAPCVLPDMKAGYGELYEEPEKPEPTFKDLSKNRMVKSSPKQK